MNRKDKNYHNKLELNSDLMETLLRLLRSNSTTVPEHRRAKILIHYHDKTDSFTAVANIFHLNRETVSTWYYRGAIINNEWNKMVINTLNETGHAGDELRKMRLIKELIGDKVRSGTPATYTAEQYTKIVKLALDKPEKYNRPITNWTARELADEADKQQIAVGISQRQIQRFLNQADLKPHKMKYWLNPNINSKEEFEHQVREICDLYHRAEVLNSQGTNIISTDEKTGIQALERKYPTIPMIQGKEELIEAEYIRNGTLCLIPSFNIATGKIDEYRIGESRNESDFTEHIKKQLKVNQKTNG